MRTLRVLAVFLAALLLPTATATVGPFAGAVKQGQSASHTYNNNPGDFECIQIVQAYTVTLTYAPPTDTLTLQVGTRSVTGSNGVATLSLVSGVCTSFAIAVTGTSVAAAAAYTVTVSSGVAGGTAIEWA